MHINLTDTVTLKSRVGPFEFRVRQFKTHPESKKQYYANVLYEFNFDNSFKATVPKQEWTKLENEFVDRKNNIRYKDILIEL